MSETMTSDARTSPSENREIARRFREELWSAARTVDISDLVAEECILHVEDPVTPRTGNGPAGLNEIIGRFLAAFPDAAVTVVDTVAEGDKVAVYWTARGTQTAPLGVLAGVAPTQKEITTSGMDLIRIAGGKVAEIRTRWDALGFLMQLGQLPSLPA
jgi:predicted ester cyclase